MTNQSMAVHESVKGFHVVRVWIRVKASASASQLRELTTFSPVYDIVSNSLPVDVMIETY